MSRIFFTQSLVHKACPSPLYSSMTFEPLPSLGWVCVLVLDFLAWFLAWPSLAIAHAWQWRVITQNKVGGKTGEQIFLEKSNLELSLQWKCCIGYGIIARWVSAVSGRTVWRDQGHRTHFDMEEKNSFLSETNMRFWSCGLSTVLHGHGFKLLFLSSF